VPSKILVEELSEPGAPYRGIGFIVEQFGRSIPQLLHKGEGIRGVYRWRSRQGWGGDQDEQADQKGAVHHVGRTFSAIAVPPPWTISPWVGGSGRLSVANRVLHPPNIDPVD
jgi:hypothetical protein